MKCETCNNKIETTFMNKIIGTYVKSEKGKKLPVCFECQKKFRTKDEILSNIR